MTGIIAGPRNDAAVGADYIVTTQVAREYRLAHHSRKVDIVTTPDIDTLGDIHRGLTPRERTRLHGIEGPRGHINGILFRSRIESLLQRSEGSLFRAVARTRSRSTHIPLAGLGTLL